IWENIDYGRGHWTHYPRRKGWKFTLYHGTTLTNALKITCDGIIPSSSGMLGPGLYLKQAILKVRVRGHPLQKSWHRKGYDTALVPPNCGMEENCVWDPKRIKCIKILIGIKADVLPLMCSHH
uniref:PARP catalytic domain-containing protein n=1 Tax=Electrophorus electricus TaxID=8005 RepID=A0A4W4GTJ9_ELEEL